jgi:glycosyltransferase involved in cell wall biosynthesis
MLFTRKKPSKRSFRKLGSASVYSEVLNLSQSNGIELENASHYSGLPTELRISKANLKISEKILEVNGWCLTPERDFDLLLQVSGTNIVAKIPPRSEERLDVFNQYPQYNEQQSGWRVKIAVEDLPAEATVQVLYVGAERRCENQRQIVRMSDPKNSRLESGETMHLTKCFYSPLRSMCQLEATMVTDRDTFDFNVVPVGGEARWQIHSQVLEPNENGHRRVKISFLASAMPDKAVLLVSEAKNSTLEASIPVTILNDSPQRKVAVTPSVLKSNIVVRGELELEDVVKLKRNIVDLKIKEKFSDEICYFPRFESSSDLSNHFHRARWYLTGENSPISKVTFAHGSSTNLVSSAPDYFATEGLDDRTLEVISDEMAYLSALKRAKTVLVWKPISKGLQSYLSETLGKPNLITVATEDPSSVEYGNYCRSPWMLLPESRKADLLKSSQERFRAALSAQRELGKTSSAVFGTGPSIDKAFDFDFRDCMTVACNSIVANEALLNHIQPAFICAGDAVSHFGVSAYAQTFRKDLIRVLKERDIFLFTSAAIGYLLIQKHPEIRDHVILCEQRLTGLNADLENIWSLPRFDSTLNIHMLPIAATFSDTVYLLGLDGRDPDPKKNEDFWAHSKAAQYHDLVDTGHQAHPTFSINRSQATEDRYLASVQESFKAGEAIGKSFFSLADSFTPAVHARPAPAHCFAPGALNGYSKLCAGPRRTEIKQKGKRALVVMRMNRRHFSGGRYHGTMLAEAMAAFCDEVVVWTNNMAPWSGDLKQGPNHHKVSYWINEFLEAPDGDFDYVITLPDGSSNPNMYHQVFKKAQEVNAKTIFINFESPNWFNALSPAPKKLTEADNWFAAACFSDVILSSAKTAVPFAERFYETLYHKPSFEVAPPAINSSIADLVKKQNLPREKQIILISRFGNVSAHKNINAIFDCITPEMEGYTLALIAGTSDLPDESTLDEFRNRLENLGLSLKLLYMISDKRKFEEIAKSELMIFPSLFEGFGYPPVEAGYMQTPCVSYDLPVLAEFNSDHAHFVPWGDEAALRTKVSELLRLPFEQRQRCAAPRVLETASLEDFSRTLESVMNNGKAPCAAKGFTEERFALAREVYLDGCHEHQLGDRALSIGELYDVADRYIRYSSIAREALEMIEARTGHIVRDTGK